MIGEVSRQSPRLFEEHAHVLQLRWLRLSHRTTRAPFWSFGHGSILPQTALFLSSPERVEGKFLEAHGVPWALYTARAMTVFKRTSNRDLLLGAPVLLKGALAYARLRPHPNVIQRGRREPMERRHTTGRRTIAYIASMGDS